jgi:hypothetical protein
MYYEPYTTGALKNSHDKDFCVSSVAPSGDTTVVVCKQFQAV